MSLVLAVAWAVSPARPAASAETFRIGVISSFTGRFAEFGEQHKAGLQVAVEEINRQGAAKGERVELVLEDDTSNVNSALSAAEKLINQKVPLIMCCYASGITKAAVQFIARERRPVLVFTSSDDTITRPGSEWIFRLNQPASLFAEVLFDVFDTINESSSGRPIETVAMVHGTGAFEDSVSQAAEGLAKGRGYKLLDNQAYDEGLTDFRPILNRIKPKNPDVLLMVSYAADSVALMRQAKEVGLNAKIFAGGAAGFAIPGFITGARDASEYVITATAWTKDVRFPGAATLNERLKQALGGREPSYHAAQAYVGVLTAVDVLRRARDMSPEAVQKALRETNLPSTPYGPIRFTDFRGYKNQNPVKMVAEQIQQGRFVTIYPREAAAGKILFPTPPWSKR